MSSPPLFCEQHGEVEPCSICKKEKEVLAPKRAGLISERDMWVLIRASLLAIVAAIEKRYGIKKQQV